MMSRVAIVAALFALALPADALQITIKKIQREQDAKNAAKAKVITLEKDISAEEEEQAKVHVDDMWSQAESLAKTSSVGEAIKLLQEDAKKAERSFAAVASDHADRLMVRVKQLTQNEIIVIVAASVFVLLVAGFLMMTRSRRGQHNDYSGLIKEEESIASSSEADTASETGSTDRVLKDRLQKFEKRMDDHKEKRTTNATRSSAVTRSSGLAPARFKRESSSDLASNTSSDQTGLGWQCKR